MFKHNLKRTVVAILLFISMSLSSFASAYEHAFNKDFSQTYGSYSSDWTPPTDIKEGWTAKFDSNNTMNFWQDGFQMEYYYDSIYQTTAPFLWESDAAFAGGVTGSLNPVGDASNIVAVALGQRGVCEYPPNSNHVDFVDWFVGRTLSDYSAYNWCCIFVIWCAENVEGRSLLEQGVFKRTGSCTDQAQYLASKGCDSVRVRDVWNNPAIEVLPGDIMFFTSSDPGYSYGHIGIVAEVGENNSYIITIEGNTNGSCAPTEAEKTPGGGVCRQKYTPTTRYANMQNGIIVRPKYP